MGGGPSRAFDSRRASSAPCTVHIVCEVIEGAGPNERRGDPEPGGKAERPGQLRGWTATPRDLIRAMSAKGDHPAGRFFSTGRPAVMARFYWGTRYKGRLRRNLTVQWLQ
jgi:hypothetical protein